MAHIHPVIDGDTHFKIDGATRSVKNVSETKTMLVQFDHNSERFTFEVPRDVDGHDLKDCNVVRVHFINIEKSHRTENTGFCDITDTLEVSPEDDSVVTCSWLIPNSATQLVGSLHFVIQFACVEGTNLLYSWNTAKHASVTITDGINSSDEVIDENIDILEEWRRKLEANHIVSLVQTTVSTEDDGENVWTATFGDGRTQELKVRNGSQGATGLVGSIETLSGAPLHFFVGTRAEYEALTEAQKEKVFAIFTDDPSPDGLITAVETLTAKVEELGQRQFKPMPIETVNNGLNMNGEGHLPEKGWYYGMFYEGNSEYYNVPVFRFDGEAETVSACFPYVLKVSASGICEVYAYATATSTESLSQVYTPRLNKVTDAVLYIVAIKNKEGA